MDQAEARGSRRLDSKAAAALYSVAVNLVLIGAKLLVGLLTGSVAILADAAHSFLDLSASIFAFAGIRTAQKPADADHAWGHAKAENISSLIQMFLLGATGIAIAIIIGTTAIEQGRRTTQVLLDAMPDRPTLQAIERILESDPRLHGYHALRARQAGKHVMLDVSVHVDGSLSLAEAHAVGHAVSARIRRELPVVTDAVVHVEPVDDDAHG